MWSREHVHVQAVMLPVRFLLSYPQLLPHNRKTLKHGINQQKLVLPYTCTDTPTDSGY